MRAVLLKAWASVFSLWFCLHTYPNVGKQKVLERDITEAAPPLTGSDRCREACETETHTVFIGVMKTDVLEVSHFTETSVLTASQPFPCVLIWWNHTVNIDTCLLPLVQKSKAAVFMIIRNHFGIQLGKNTHRPSTSIHLMFYLHNPFLLVLLKTKDKCMLFAALFSHIFNSCNCYSSALLDFIFIISFI